MLLHQSLPRRVGAAFDRSESADRIRFARADSSGAGGGS
jgi:hypothetical protein